MGPVFQYHPGENVKVTTVAPYLSPTGMSGTHLETLEMRYEGDHTEKYMDGNITTATHGMTVVVHDSHYSHAKMQLSRSRYNFYTSIQSWKFILVGFCGRHAGEMSKPSAIIPRYFCREQEQLKVGLTITRLVFYRPRRGGGNRLFTGASPSLGDVIDRCQGYDDLDCSRRCRGSSAWLPFAVVRCWRSRWIRSSLPPLHFSICYVLEEGVSQRHFPHRGGKADRGQP